MRFGILRGDTMTCPHERLENLLAAQNAELREKVRQLEADFEEAVEYLRAYCETIDSHNVNAFLARIDARKVTK
jgi:hypothetical protein